MKKFNITVNGKAYQVEVEEVGTGQPSFVAPPVQPVVQSAPKSVQQPAPKTVVKAGAGDMAAPMPGTILDIKVKEGQLVKAGDVILILEAMKMENEIVAPEDGKIVKIHTSKGSAVSTGDALVTIG